VSDAGVRAWLFVGTNVIVYSYDARFADKRAGD
jgi:hypothetical protein